MELLTVGQVAAGLALVVGIIKGTSYLMEKLKSMLMKSISEVLAPISEKVDAANQKIDEVDLNACKDFLVDFLADVEQGKEIDEVTKSRFHERYSHYQKLGGNSYIHDKVEKLKKAGKL